MNGVFVGIGGNLAHPRHGMPAAVLAAAVAALSDWRVRVIRSSTLYRTAPVPASDQPDCLNAVLQVAPTEDTDPHALLNCLQAVEAAFGRRRGERNAARVLDLDLLAWDTRVVDDAVLSVPHPRLHERAFTLVPLAELAPDWRHPRLHRTAAELCAALPKGQRIDVANPVEAALWAAVCAAGRPPAADTACQQRT